MTPTAVQHPTPDDLGAYALGKLDAAALERIRAHLEACPPCRTLVEQTPADTWVALLRKAVTRPGETPAAQGAQTKGTLPVPNPHVDEAELPPELRDHPRYRIVRALGRGGMGIVYQAEHKLMERPVAVKVIAADLVASPEAVERFQREVRAAAKLEHAHIVRAYDAERAGSLILLAMEYVEGRTLADVVAAKGPLPVGYACRCVRQAAQGLQHAYEQGMVHRDIKPHNLMLSAKGVVKVLDFGLAKLATERASRDGGLTGRDVTMGTPEYMAPEQARDTAAADVRADIYALGGTLFCLLTGRPPFAGATPIDVMLKHMQDAPPRVTDLRPEVPAGLADLIDRMLAKDPAARPQTPKEVAEALGAFAKPGAKVSPPRPAQSAFAGLPHVTMSAPRPPRPRRWSWAVGVGVAGLLLAFAGLWAGGVFRVKTADGTIVVQVNEPDADVVIDGERVKVTTRGEEPIEIRKPAGKHTLEVEKGGFKAESRELTLTAGGREPVTVRLERAADPRPPAQWQALIAPGSYHIEYYRSSVQATTVLKADNSFHRVRSQNLKSAGTLEFCDGKLVLKCDDFVEVWAVQGGKIIVTHWWPNTKYPGGDPGWFGVATHLNE
jgi:hypothetical protein